MPVKTHSAARAPLFETRDHTDARTVRFNETLYQFLDRVADVYFGRTRVLLNDWFAELADDVTAERLRRDFAAGRSEQVEGAFWELYLHAALTRTPLCVELEPGRSQGRQPDFRAWPQKSEASDFYVEARAIGDRPEDRARRRSLQGALQSLDAVPPLGFQILLGRVTVGASTPSGGQLRRQILNWLGTLDRERLRGLVESGDAALPEELFTVGDASFEVKALPLAEGVVRRSLIAAGPVSVGWGGSRETLASALEKKRSRYNLGGRPFLIAVGNVHSLADGEDVIDTLYGDPAIRILGEDRTGELVTESIRRGNGFFGHRNTRVSGLLHALRVVPWAVGDVVPELWLNPFARTSLTQRFPWARTLEVANDGSLAATEPTVTMRGLFGLSADWPGPEQPFERRSFE